MKAGSFKLACMPIAVMWLSWLAPLAAFGDASGADDRIALTADGSTLTGTDGGGGGSVAWLHNFDASTLTDVAAEHQALADSQWTFGSLSASYGLGPADQRYTLAGEVHEGGGVDSGHSFRYEIEAAGITGTFVHKLSALLEDRRIDVETIHGNLPKAGLAYLWGPHLLTTVSYQYSTSGNLGTRLTAARLDLYEAKLNFFAGTAFGPATAAILNIESRVLAPAHHLQEEYVGVSVPFARWHSQLTVVADYLDLSGIDRASLTLTYIFHLGG